MRKIVLAALFATVSSITGASLTPAAGFGGQACTWTNSDGTCRIWGSSRQPICKARSLYVDQF